jgi:hypothetical protein
MGLNRQQSRSESIPWNETIARQLSDVIQRTLNTIKDGVHDAGAELNRKSLSLAHDRVADGEPTGVLVHLNGGSVSLQTNDLAYQFMVTHTDQLKHGSAGHALGNDHCLHNDQQV